MAVPLGRKTVVRRPGTNEGGREEEERRSGLAVERTECEPEGPHNREKTGDKERALSVAQAMCNALGCEECIFGKFRRGDAKL